MKNTNEKADNIIVLQMVFAATANQKGVSVIADYTDVLLCCASLFGSETWTICSISTIFTLHRWFIKYILLNFG